MKKYRYIIIPALLLIYLVVIAWWTHPEKNPSLSYTQYYITLTVSLAIIIGASFAFKKKDHRRK